MSVLMRRRPMRNSRDRRCEREESKNKRKQGSTEEGGEQEGSVLEMELRVWVWTLVCSLQIQGLCPSLSSPFWVQWKACLLADPYAWSTHHLAHLCVMATPLNCCSVHRRVCPHCQRCCCGTATCQSVSICLYVYYYCLLLLFFC